VCAINIHKHKHACDVKCVCSRAGAFMSARVSSPVRARVSVRASVRVSVRVCVRVCVHVGLCTQPVFGALLA
jgi:hypothetical protein